MIKLEKYYGDMIIILIDPNPINTGMLCVVITKKSVVNLDIFGHMIYFKHLLISLIL